MCGLVGWTFNQNCTLTLHQRASLLQLGAFGADKRGGQSWGLLTVDNGKPRVTRGLGALVQRNFEKVARHPFGFAHSRYATHGKVTYANCHPFERGDIIGAHNGVLSNAWELDREFGNEDVDSVHIFKRLAAGETLDKLQGYGVIEFYNKKFGSTIMLANIGGGSVTVFKLPKNMGYYWTSLKEDGELALEAVGITTAKEVDIVVGRVYAFHVDKEVYPIADMELKLGERSYNCGGAMGFQGSDWNGSHKKYGRQVYRDGKWDDDTGEFPNHIIGTLTAQEKADIREEVMAEYMTAEEETPAIVEKEWVLGTVVEKQPETDAMRIALEIAEEREETLEAVLAGPWPHEEEKQKTEDKQEHAFLKRLKRTAGFTG